jgi:hypothetical protein
VGACCASHPEAPATWTCPRCGGFMCAGCERRVRPDALPLCPSCWGLRGQKVAATPRSTRLENAGLWLGAFSLTCLPPVVMASVVVNLVVLVRAAPGGRRKPLLGLGLTVGGVAVTVTVFTLLLSPMF